MCGFLVVTGNICSQLQDSDVLSAADYMSYRGPDHTGFYRAVNERFIGLHLRLAIVKADASANQPFHYQGSTLLFNGEIYNFKQFNADSDSDTEVLCQTLANVGTSAMSSMRGMFAGVFQKGEEIIVFRDAVGKKPFYMSKVPQGMIYSSEVRPILKIRKLLGLKNTICDSGLSSFIIGGATHNYQTIISEVTELPNNTVARFNLSGERLESQDIYDFNDRSSIAPGTSFEALLTDSVRLRTVSDFPIASLLSGGIDSLAVSSVLSELDKDVTLYTLQSKGNQSEVDVAIKAAKQLKMKHVIKKMATQSPQDSIEIIRRLDLPNGDSSFLNMMAIMEQVKEDFRVCITGDGGDEILSGYAQYRWMENGGALSRFWPLGKILSSNVEALSRQRLTTKYLSLFSPQLAAQQFYSRFTNPGAAAKVFTNFEHSTSNERAEFYLSFAQKLDNSDMMSAIEYSDAMTVMRELILFKTDRSSMLHSVELRSPLLDARIVAYCLGLTRTDKVKNGLGKLPLRQVVSDKLSSEYLELPKMGFGVDLKSLFNDANRSRYFDRLLEPLQTLGFDMDQLFNLLKTLEGTKGKLYYALLSLALWVDTNHELLDLQR